MGILWVSPVHENQAMGLIWVHFLFSLYHRFPIACKVIPRTYGFGMAFPYQIIPKCYGNSMELCEIRRNPIYTRYDHMVLLWGSPMQFPHKSYGGCMELYEIRSKPIGLDNRM